MKLPFMAISTLFLLTNHAQAADLSARQIKKSAQYCVNKSSCHTQKIEYPNRAMPQWINGQSINCKIL